MRWASFLHLYQPANQQEDILQAVVAQSYRPVLFGIKNNSRVRLTLNVNGALLELFDKHGYRDLIDVMRQLMQEDRLELTGCAKYHAFLPLLEQKEVIRQITLNEETIKFFLGDSYKAKGFFPPEMGYTEELAPIISEMGFEWIILDEIAFCGEVEKVDYSKIYKIKNTNLLAFFRQRRLSNLIMSAVVRSSRSLSSAMKQDVKGEKYLITAMDGETFGHHRPGLEKMLLDLFAAPQFGLIKVSDIPKYFTETLEVNPLKSTWAASPQDIKNHLEFLSWCDPENIIHQWQWAFFRLVLDEVHAMDENNPSFPAARAAVDIAMASDHFWWASAKPWWSLEMIENGAFQLLEALRMIPNVSPEKFSKAQDLYEKIISTAFGWQRSGRIRKNALAQKEILRIPFLDRTVGAGGAEEGVFSAFVDMMKTLEKKAARSGEYEKAILWRDAIYKLENKLDIYDAMSAIDLLRLELPNEKIEKTVEKYKQEYQKIRGGQPEQRGA